MKNNYRVGDFVRLVQPENYLNTRIINNNLNVFEILEISDQNVRLRWIKEELSICAIAPIPANRVDDKDIYLAPWPAADVVSCDEPLPARTKNETYYLDELAECPFDGLSFQELIAGENLEFVHDIQHFLQDRFQRNDLKIAAY